MPRPVLRLLVVVIGAVLVQAARAQGYAVVRFIGVISSWDKDSTASAVALTAYDTVPGALPIRATCDAKGTCRMELPLDRVYRIEFSAARHATAHLLLDTHGPSIKQRKWGYRVRVALTLLPRVPGLDYSIWDKPVALGSFDPKDNQFTWDEGYSAGFSSYHEILQNAYLDRKHDRPSPPGTR